MQIKSLISEDIESELNQDEKCPQERKSRLL